MLRKRIIDIFTLITAVFLLGAFAVTFTACPNGDGGGKDNSNVGKGGGGGDTGGDTGGDVLVDSVTVTPNPASVTKGYDQQFKATVAGQNNPSKDVTWTVQGGGAGTGISTSGLLTVAAGETASALTVTATSTFDTTKSGTASVALNANTGDWVKTVFPGGASPSIVYDGQTATVNFTGLSSKDIYLVKVNTSSLEVKGADTGTVLNLSPSLPEILRSPINSGGELPIFGHPAAERFNANPPPIVNTAGSQMLRSADFIAPVVDDKRIFWVETSFNSLSFIQKEAILMATGAYGNIWVLDNSINTSQAEALADKFDQIYTIATNILGYEYGDGPGGDGGKDSDPKVQILVFGIGSGIGGYFWAKDFYNDSQLPSGWRSNLAEIFYIDAGFVRTNPSVAYSVLVHEFQHMINWNQKRVRNGKDSEAWYDEMLSMMAEDVISPIIGVGPSSSGHPIQQRIPNFLKNYYLEGITEWKGVSGTLSNYETKYAFGAYLLRNYGGAEILKKIMANNTANADSITSALKEISGELDFKQALIRYGEALIFSGTVPESIMTFDRTVTKDINGFSYTAQRFNIWTDFTQKGPSIYNLTQRELRPNTIGIHQDNTWKNVSGSKTITLQKPNSSDVMFILMVK